MLNSLVFSLPGPGQRAQDQCVDFCLALSLTGSVQVSISSGHSMHLSTKVIYPDMWTGKVILLRQHNGARQLGARGARQVHGGILPALRLGTLK